MPLGTGLRDSLTRKALRERNMVEKCCKCLPGNLEVDVESVGHWANILYFLHLALEEAGLSWQLQEVEGRINYGAVKAAEVALFSSP